MERPNAPQAIGAGFIATVLTTLLPFGGPALGLPPIDFAATLGALVNGGQAASPLSGAWWSGLTIHVVAGTLVFPLVYARVLFAILPGRPWTKGATFGLILWLLSQVVRMPALRLGFFGTNAPRPFLGAIAILIADLLYGILLGWISGGGGTAERFAVGHARRAA